MKINLKNVKNALNRDEMRSISGGCSSQPCTDRDGHSLACNFDSDCRVVGSNCYCRGTLKIGGNDVKVCR